MSKNFKSKLYGGMFGLLIGDAVGVPYEFKKSHEIFEIDMFPKKINDKSYPDVDYGTWSDDGSQSLILLDSLIKNKKLDMNDFLNKLLQWLDQGYFAIDNKVFDVGSQTYEYISQYKKNGSFEIIPCGASQNGNGSLMRCLPLVFWHRGTNEELVYLAHMQSLATHPHIRSQVCCALYCLVAKNLLNDKPTVEAFAHAVEELKSIYVKTKNELAIFELKTHILSYDLTKCSGSGYVVDSLMTALLCLHENNYESVIKKAISFGNDTDTTACIAGGLAGIVFGVNGIPEQWMNGLRGKSMVYPLLEELL